MHPRSWCPAPAAGAGSFYSLLIFPLMLLYAVVKHARDPLEVPCVLKYSMQQTWCARTATAGHLYIAKRLPHVVTCLAQSHTQQAPNHCPSTATYPATSHGCQQPCLQPTCCPTLDLCPTYTTPAAAARSPARRCKPLHCTTGAAAAAMACAARAMRIASRPLSPDLLPAKLSWRLSALTCHACLPMHQVPHIS